ncbi:MAG: relaxase domain-containing protein [Spirochaetes bacterium]|nr:relaxase domain-containing protein [Spirochaetota bacterium]
MLSISKAKCASQGMKYFEADSYYVKKNEQGHWFGKCIDELGLSDGIEREEFRRILDGFDLDGNALVRNTLKGNRRAYVDFTFSCPKSVSILSYSDEKIVQAHNEAVNKALSEIQSKYAITREGAGGCESYRTDNIIAARFNHHESRELDPQLHCHCVVMNMTKGRDGKYRSLEMGEMFKNQLYIGQVYRNQLSLELQKIGYKIEVTERYKGLFEIAGIDKEILEEFSTRRKQIVEKLKSSPIEYERCGQRAEAACLLSRKRKSDTDIEIIREKMAVKLSGFGTSLEEVKLKALQIDADKTETTQLSKAECIRMAIEDVTEHQSAFKKEAVVTLAMKNGLGRYTAKEIEEEFERFSDIKHVGKKDLFIGKTVSPAIDYYTTYEIENVELGIIAIAEKNSVQSTISVDRAIVDKYLSEVAMSGIELSRGQKDAISMVCTTEKNVNLIQGDAGSGKTFAVEQVRTLMEKNGITVRGFAPTGKAAVELQSAGISTSTIDSFLLSSKKEIQEGELWVVDESGMIGSRKLLRFLNDAVRFNAKVVLIGDSKQFTSVEQGKMFSDLQNNSSAGYAEITENKRQKTAHMRAIVGELKRRTTTGIHNAFNKLDGSGCVQEIKDREKRLLAVASDYLVDREEHKDSLVLASTNTDRHELNRNIRKTLVSKGVIEQGSEYEVLQNAGLSGNVRRFANSYKVGQRIFFQKEFDGIKSGTGAEITQIDSNTNTLIIKYRDKATSKDQVKILNLFQAATKIQSFNVYKRNFGRGDSIITLKNDKLLKVENGKIGTIKKIDASGNVDVLFSRREVRAKDSIYKMNLKNNELILIPNSDFGHVSKGTEYRIVDANKKSDSIVLEYYLNNTQKKIAIRKENLKDASIFIDSTSHFNLGKYQYCDHAYSVTSYKSQGCTLDRVRVLHDQSHKTNYNEMYVAVTRARQNAVIYTDDFNKLVKQAVKEQEKDSVIDFKPSLNINEPEHEKSIEDKINELLESSEGKKQKEIELTASIDL